MSVLIEANTLIVRRSFLDASYPGGTEGFLAFCRERAPATRYALADDGLAAISSFDPDQLFELADHLVERDAVIYRDGDYVDLAFADQQDGPLRRCTWLAFERVESLGFSMAWLAQSIQGGLASPPGWDPERYPEPVAGAPIPGSDHLLRLGSRDGRDLWLDLLTGQELSTPSPEATLLDLASQELGNRGINFQRIDEVGCLLAVLGNGKGKSLGLQVRVCLERQQVIVLLRLPRHVPLARLHQAAEFVTRANYGLSLGCFDLDWNDGEVLFRTSISAAEGPVSPAMIGNLIDAGLWSVHTYAAGLDRIIAGEHPRAVIDDLEAPFHADPPSPEPR